AWALVSVAVYEPTYGPRSACSPPLIARAPANTARMPRADTPATPMILGISSACRDRCRPDPQQLVVARERDPERPVRVHDASRPEAQRETATRVEPDLREARDRNSRGDRVRRRIEPEQLAAGSPPE